LFDAYHVPKPLSQQLLPFGISVMDWRSCPSGSSSFLLCPCLADGPRGPSGRSTPCVFVACSSCSCSFLFSIRRGFKFWLARFRMVRVNRADSPRVPRGQSACSPRTVRYSWCVSGGSVAFFGQSASQAGWSAARVRTVRDNLPDSPRGLCGQSAPPGRTIRQSLTALFLGSIPPSFLRASACASKNRS
jgi:hypothetical protein